ncbi:hypothetical protein SAMN05518871_104127 [Psychrobacillus sp. OK028]|nr:hypothetical protein SAMN05518871_104127 [Psychrobacillus sp. OK028]
MVDGPMSLISQILFLGPIFSKMERKYMNILVHKPNKHNQNIFQELFLDGKGKVVIRGN